MFKYPVHYPLYQYGLIVCDDIFWINLGHVLHLFSRHLHRACFFWHWSLTLYRTTKNCNMFYKVYISSLVDSTGNFYVLPRFLTKRFLHNTKVSAVTADSLKFGILGILSWESFTTRVIKSRIHKRYILRHFFRFDVLYVQFLAIYRHYICVYKKWSLALSALSSNDSESFPINHLECRVWTHPFPYDFPEIKISIEERKTQDKV